ncbi:hypothetical protein F2Q70_00007158 [Brassica cretica]|uniref:Late embryogenesis abundant protein LEA-2 subgroup domain-containing protein n=1 Tax=Brassica cretica TaxID=69181 RepID=A0A8S9LYG6_BRACR|nr:hypothetical protein F2Q70_00007158 [Brassica cretica]
MPVKECGSHASNSPRLLNFIRRNIICLVIFIIVTIIGIVLAWVILHSPKPRFILQDATVFSFNVSGDPPNVLTSSIQTTLISRNLNGKTGLVLEGRMTMGQSGQAVSIIGGPIAAVLSTPMRLVTTNIYGMAATAVSVYCASRYATDIGMRADVAKVEVEDLTRRLSVGLFQVIEPPVAAVALPTTS